MSSSWFINFKSIQSGHAVARGRKRTVFDSFRSDVAAGTLSHSGSLYWVSPVSHCSRLLIGLLLCIGVRVIGYFTRVRLELVKGKGQATGLSPPCTALIHQLLSVHEGSLRGQAGTSSNLVRGSLVNPLTRGSTPLPISLKLMGLQLRLRAPGNGVPATAA